MTEPTWGHWPEQMDDGSYVQHAARFGYVLIHPDGTITDLSGNQIAPSSGSSYSDEKAQDAVGTILGSRLDYSDAGPSITLNVEAIQDLVGAMAGAGLAYDDASNEVDQDVAVSGQVTLSSGTAVVSTGLSATDATFMLAIGVDDPNADCKLTGRLFWDDSADPDGDGTAQGAYKIEIVEDGTNIGNPTANYDVVRVR